MAKVVPDDVERRVDATLSSLRERAGRQIAVAVIDTTGDKTLEDYSIDLARSWGSATRAKATVSCSSWP